MAVTQSFASKDEQLYAEVQKLIDGNYDGYEKVYELSKKYIYKIINDIVKDHHTTEDMMQETYLQIYNKIGTLREARSFYVWAGRIASNLTLRYLQKYRKELLTEGTDEDGEDFIFDKAENDHEEFIPESVLDNKEQQRIITEILDGLSPEQKLCVQYYYYEEMSVGDIANVMECSTGTIKSRLNYARKALKEAISKFEVKSGVKLYSISALPIYYIVFRSTAESVTLAGVAGVAGAAGAAGGVGATTTTAATGIMGTIAGKIAVAVVCVALGAGVAVTSTQLIKNNAADEVVEVAEIETVENIEEHTSLNNESVEEEIAMPEDRSTMSVEARMVDNMYSFDMMADELEAKYDFTGDLESNLENYTFLQTDIESYLEEQMKKGRVITYSKAPLSYLITFEDDFEYIYSAPFQIEGMMGNGGTENTSVNVVDNTVTEMSTDISSVKAGRILTMEPLSECKEATNSLIPAAENVVKAGLNYSIDSIGTAECSDFNTLVSYLLNLDKYDMVFVEAHGACYSDRIRDVYNQYRIQISKEVLFKDLVNFSKANPDFSFIDTGGLKKIPGVILGDGTYVLVSGEMRNDVYYEGFVKIDEKTGEAKIPEKISLSLSADFFQYVYDNKPLNDTIFYFCCCQLMNTPEFSQTLLGLGARAVMGYMHSVMGDYSKAMVTTIMRQMPSVDSSTGELYTLENAIKIAKKENGRMDPSLTDDFLKLLSVLNDDLYEETWERAVLMLATNESDIRLKDYSTITQETLIEEGEVFEESDGETQYGYLSEEQLEQAYTEYKDVRDRLIDERKALDDDDRIDIQEALTNAMNLFFVVSCDCGYHMDWSSHQRYAKYDGLGCAYYSDIINYYEKKKKISYNNFLYIGGQYSGVNTSMEGYISAIEKRNKSKKPLTDTEKEALVLIKKYVSTFYVNRTNLEKVLACLQDYMNNYKPNDSNRLVIKDNKGKHEEGIEKYFKLLEEFKSVELSVRE